MSVLFGNQGYFIPTSLSTSATNITVTWNNAITQAISVTGASGNITLTLSTPVIGGVYNLKIIAGPSSFTCVFPNTVLWRGRTVPTWSLTASSVDWVRLQYDGTNYYAYADLNFG